MFRVNQKVFTGREELPSCLVFVVKCFVKGVESFDKVVAGYGFLDILEDIWGISESLLFGCKVGGYTILKRLQEVVHEYLLKSGRNTGFK